MKKKNPSPFEGDTRKRLQEDPEFAEAFFEELMERPLPVQLGILRRLVGISQAQLASRFKVTQAYLSKLEKEGSDHLISAYAKLAKLLHGRLAIIPEGARIVLPKITRLPRAA